MSKKKKKNRVGKKIGRKILIIFVPILIVNFMFLVVGSTIMMYFSKASFNDKLSNTENNDLIQLAKDKSNEVNKAFKDYYSTDKRFSLGYQYILGYSKYLIANNEFDNKESDYNFDQCKSIIDDAYEKLKPNFEYKKDKIITIREYKVKVKKLKKMDIDINIIDKDIDDQKDLKDGITYCNDKDITYTKKEDVVTKQDGKPKELNDVNILKEKPTDLKNYSVESKLYSINESQFFKVVEEEETKTEKKEQDAYFITSAKTISGSYAMEYESKTDVTKKNNEKITTTKLVLKSMKQIDKKWDVLKSIIKDNFPNEDVENALEVILTSATSYVSDKIDLDMIYTGGGGSVNPESFTGGQADFIQKVSKEAVKEYKEHGILPSITIAQAILESGWGKSGLTQKANNLFGIKAYGWNGSTIDMMTAEYDSAGNEYFIVAAFRAYDSWDASVDDHTKILLQSNFKEVQTAKDYREAAYALKQGGYATDPGYPESIISVIQMYSLDRYDSN